MNLIRWFRTDDSIDLSQINSTQNEHSSSFDTERRDIVFDNILDDTFSTILARDIQLFKSLNVTIQRLSDQIDTLKQTDEDLTTQTSLFKKFEISETIAKKLQEYKQVITVRRSLWALKMNCHKTREELYAQRQSLKNQIDKRLTQKQDTFKTIRLTRN